MAFWVTKEGVWGGGGEVGHWPTQRPYHTSPLSFTVIKMNRDLRGWAEVHVSHLTSQKLTTQEVNVKVMRKKGRFGEADMLTDTSTPGLAFPRLSLRYICPTLFIQSLSEQAKCASPGRKLMHFNTR